MGIETLSLRMERHVANAVRVATWLENDPAHRACHLCRAAVLALFRPGGPKVCPKGAGALFTFALRRAATTPACGWSTR
jgi:O-acetylhomoserine (thiol)-lyase